MNRLFTVIKPKRTLRMSIQYLKYSKKDFKLLDLNKCINRLTYGFAIKMITKTGKQSPAPILFYILEDDPTKLQWLIDGKSPMRCRLDLRTVMYITEIPTILRPKVKEKFGGACLLTIHYGRDQELILMFDDEKTKIEWWCGLQHFIDLSQKEEKDLETVSTVLAREIFNRADIDGTKSLDKEEVREMLKGLQIYVKSKEIENFFEMYDTDKNKRIDMHEFEVFVTELLRKEELVSLFRKYCALYGERRYSEPSMTLIELLRFFQEEQLQTITMATLRRLHRDFEEINVSKPCVSFDFFCTLIFSQRNTIFNPEHSYNYQDMTKPITDYYINSSHNTYLLSNQLTGESSIHAYVSALKKGCRCVELDIWTGSNSVPIIYHGHTMTTKIYCEDVIKALKEHAFLTSPYPLILSFEMHCDKKTQKNLVDMLERELGEMIYTIPDDYEDYEYYPSPEELKNKFIIKGSGKLKNDCNVDDASEASDNIEPLVKGRFLNMTGAGSHKSANHSIEDLAILMGSVTENLAVSSSSRAVNLNYLNVKNCPSNFKRSQMDSSNQDEDCDYNDDDDENNGGENEDDDDEDDDDGDDNEDNINDNGTEFTKQCDDEVVLSHRLGLSRKIEELDHDISKIREDKMESKKSTFQRKRQFTSAAPRQISNKPKLHVLQANRGDDQMIQQSKNLSRVSKHSHRTRASVGCFHQPFQSQDIGRARLNINIGSESIDLNSSGHNPRAWNIKAAAASPSSAKLSYPNLGKNAGKVTSFPSWGGIDEKFRNRRRISESKAIELVRSSIKYRSASPIKVTNSNRNPVVKKKKKVDKVIPELNRLYAMIGRPMHLESKRSIWEISSMNESRIARMFKFQHEKIVDFHKRYFSRIYPLGSRFDSSNYDPTIGWAAGSQIVALNFQKNDEPMLLNFAKFIANGGVYSGYTLKPKYMRHDCLTCPEFINYPANFKKPLKKLSIQVISGQQIRPENPAAREIINPYVEIKIKGLDIDEQSNSVCRTQAVKDNGFHPIWARNKDNCKFEFQISAPDFCTLVVTVYHEDVMSKERLGWYAIEFKNIQSGYRIVPLMNSYLQYIPGSSILCRITISDL